MDSHRALVNDLGSSMDAVVDIAEHMEQFGMGERVEEQRSLLIGYVTQQQDLLDRIEILEQIMRSHHANPQVGSLLSECELTLAAGEDLERHLARSDEGYSLPSPERLSQVAPKVQGVRAPYSGESRPSHGPLSR